MKILCKYATVAMMSVVGLSLPAAATIQLTFTDVNYLNSSGTNPGGMVWGLVFDTDGDGFDSSYQAGFTVSNNSLMGGSNDDTLYLSTFTIGGSGSTGIITDMNDVPDTYASTAFAVIWFDSNLSSGSTVSVGDFYGFQSTVHTQGTTDGNNVSPSSGGSLAYDASGYGAADLQFTAVPESSTTLIGGLGVLLLLRRRRSNEA